MCIVSCTIKFYIVFFLVLHQVCPALAMGNTVVLKPASYTRLTALLFAEICAEAGLPPGNYMQLIHLFCLHLSS